MNIQEYLVLIGYASKRKIYKNKQFLYVDNFMNSFSSMVNGGSDVRYVKGDREIVFGLHEKGKPPTLIYPRPKIKVTRINPITRGEETISEQYDDSMNIVLSKEPVEMIYKAMFDKQILFEYNLIK